MRNVAILVLALLAVPLHSVDAAPPPTRLAIRAAQKDFDQFVSKDPGLKAFHDGNLRDLGVKQLKRRRLGLGLFFLASTAGSVAMVVTRSTHLTGAILTGVNGSAFLHSHAATTIAIEASEKAARTATLRKALDDRSGLRPVPSNEQISAWERAGILDR